MESMMIRFSAVCEKHTTLNINRWFLETLNKYDINNNNTIITDCWSNMIALHRENYLVVCFAHKLHTVIATTFTKTKETDNLLLNINRTITDIITFYQENIQCKRKLWIYTKRRWSNMCVAINLWNI